MKLSVDLPPEEHAMLVALAKAEDRSQASMVRELIRRGRRRLRVPVAVGGESMRGGGREETR